MPCKKVRFETEGAAKLATWRAMYSRSSKRGEFRYYYCRECKCFHLTSKVQTR